jgi:hypothetical protein
LVECVLRLDDPLFEPKLSLVLGLPLPPLAFANSSGPHGIFLKPAQVRRILDIYRKDYEFIESLSDAGDLQQL